MADAHAAEIGAGAHAVVTAADARGVENVSDARAVVIALDAPRVASAGVLAVEIVPDAHAAGIDAIAPGPAARAPKIKNIPARATSVTEVVASGSLVQLVRMSPEALLRQQIMTMWSQQPRSVRRCPKNVARDLPRPKRNILAPVRRSLVSLRVVPARDRVAIVARVHHICRASVRVLRVHAARLIEVVVIVVNGNASAIRVETGRRVALVAG